MSVRFQADNDLNFALVKAARRREPAIDFASAQESHLDGVNDPEVLERSAEDGRVLVSHDRHTMIDHFHSRLRTGKSSPGLLIVPQDSPIREVVEALVLVWALSDQDELVDQAYYLPSLSRHVFS